jgi:hypothetical protein
MGSADNSHAGRIVGIIRGRVQARSGGARSLLADNQQLVEGMRFFAVDDSN